MKKLKKGLFFGIVLAGCLLVSHMTSAQTDLSQPTGDTPVDRLQASCSTVQPTLRRIHTSDSLMRVNIGQYYNGISVKLMARLNSRLALNRLDSTKFIEITNQFEGERTAFAKAYSDYEVNLSTLLKIDCQDEPTEFYAELLKTRDARHKLSKTVQDMNDSVSEYRKAVEDLKQTDGEPS